MRDPFSWSLPLGRVFGITVRVHMLFFVFVLAMWIKVAVNSGNEQALWLLVLMGLLFLSVLLHEFGHCFAARHVDGEANEILLWPLGGLAKFDSLPHSP